jgi:hypothetical protein
MGEAQGTLFPLRFNRSLHLRSTPERLTADSGAVLLREIGERLGLWRLLERELADPRDPERITHPFVELLRTAVLAPAQGWCRQRDVDFLRDDPAFRLAVSKRRGEGPLRPPEDGAARVPDGLASQATMSRLMAGLSAPENRDGLSRVMCGWAARREGLSVRRPREEIVVDLDSLPQEVHGHQEGSAYNGHYRCRCFHPLVLSWEFGDFLDARLREGNVYTSTDALEFVRPHLRWVGALTRRGWLRIDAGFPDEDFLAGVEAEAPWRYVSRLRSNAVLERRAEPYVAEIVAKGEAREERTHVIELGGYRAEHAKKKWSRERRVVLVIEERPRELVPHWFFLVTNASAQEASGMALLERYRRRGRTEKDYGEWQNALKVALSSTNRTKGGYLGEPPRRRSRPVDSFAVNEALLLVSLLTANLMHVGRVLVERATSRTWSRQTFRQWVLKTPGRVARHARYVRLWIHEKRAELWQAMAAELDRLAGGLSPPRAAALPSAS